MRSHLIHRRGAHLHADYAAGDLWRGDRERQEDHSSAKVGSPDAEAAGAAALLDGNGGAPKRYRSVGHGSCGLLGIGSAARLRHQAEIKVV